MNCEFCNYEIPAGADFCPNCGRTVSKPVVNAAPAATVIPNVPRPSLAMGILSLVFCWCFLGIIFGAKGGSNVNRYRAAGGQVTGSVKVGQILSKIGLIIAIIYTVIEVIAFFAGILAAL